MEELRTRLTEALAEGTGLAAEEIARQLRPPRQAAHGDLAFPCFAAARRLGRPPAELAAELARTLPLPAGVAAAEAVGPFLNFRYDRPWVVEQVVGRILAEGDRYGAAPSTGRTVVVDFSSPNIAKPFHVGHLRGTLLGWSLIQILRFLGEHTVGINHLGDWGTQFGYVWVGCARWGRPTPDDPDPISTLVDRYVRAYRLSEEDPAVEEEARAFFRRLERGDPEARRFWAWAREISLAEFQAVYKRLGISFDSYTGEAFFNDKMEPLLKEVEAAGIGTVSEGAFGVDLGGDLGFAMLRKADGTTLYLTRDLAAVEYRYQTYRFDRALYVVGAPQSLHFKQLVGVLAQLGKPYADRVVHVAFGHVHGMSTRAGGAVPLKEFLDEAHRRALQVIREEVEKRPEGLDEEAVAEKVALAAIFFHNLSVARIKDVQFDWGKALTFRGDSGPYLQYAHARIHGIAAKAGAQLPERVEGRWLPEPEAYELALVLSRFPATVRRAAAEYEPAIVASYLLEAAHTFSRANEVLRVKDTPPPVRDQRFALFWATRQVLATGLKLLGIEPVERM